MNLATCRNVAARMTDSDHRANGYLADPIGYFEVRIGTLDHDGETSMPGKFGKSIRAIGGDYGDARSIYASDRVVSLPMTDAGVDLALDLVTLYPRKCSKEGAVFVSRPRAKTSADAARVFYQRDARNLEARLYAEIGRAAGLAFAAAERREEERLAEVAARLAKLREERARLLARLAEIDAELGA